MKKDNTQLATSLLEELTSSRSIIRCLKDFLVSKKSFELASLIREIEREKFPLDSEKNKEAMIIAEDLNKLFKVGGINMPESVAYSAYKIVHLYDEENNLSTLKDVSEIVTETENIFGV